MIMVSQDALNFISFTFNDKTSVKSFNNETIRELVGIIKRTPTFDKKNAYFIVDNQVVFLENVDTIKWKLD
jgi:hypothetical protein